MKRILQILFALAIIAACSPAVYSTSTPPAGANQVKSIEDDIKNPANQTQFPCTLPAGGTGVQVCHVPPNAAPVDICAAIPVCTPAGGGDDNSSADDNSSNDDKSADGQSTDANSGDSKSGGSGSHSCPAGFHTTTVGGQPEICSSTGIPDDGGQNFIGKCSDTF